MPQSNLPETNNRLLSSFVVYQPFEYTMSSSQEVVAYPLSTSSENIARKNLFSLGTSDMFKANTWEDSVWFHGLISGCSITIGYPRKALLYEEKTE
jgi:hypothetical protein